MPSGCTCNSDHKHTPCTCETRIRMLVRLSVIDITQTISKKKFVFIRGPKRFVSDVDVDEFYWAELFSLCQMCPTGQNGRFIDNAKLITEWKLCFFLFLSFVSYLAEQCEPKCLHEKVKVIHISVTKTHPFPIHLFRLCSVWYYSFVKRTDEIIPPTYEDSIWNKNQWFWTHFWPPLTPNAMWGGIAPSTTGSVKTSCALRSENESPKRIF